MPDDKEPSNNPFIRFKQHVDANIQAGLNSVAGLSSTFSRSHRSTSNPEPEPEPSHAHSTNPTTTSSDPAAMLDDPADPPTALQRLQPSAQLEAALDALRGGTPRESRAAWDLFLAQSAYSPLRLRRELGWHPRPRYDHGDHHHHHHHHPGAVVGMNGGYDERDYWIESSSSAAAPTGWLDAFEDLLLASSAAEMVDPRERRRRYYSSSPWGHPRMLGWHGFFPFPFSGSSSSWGWGSADDDLIDPISRRGGMMHHAHVDGWAELRWLRRMESAGLREVYFPVGDARYPGLKTPGTLEEWAERRRKEKERMTAREDPFAAFDREMRGRGGVDEAEEDGDAIGSFFSDIGGVVKALGKLLEDEVTGERGTAASAQEKGKDEAETEGDLYSVIRSAFNESERSLSNFFKSISEARRDDGFWESKPASPPKTETTEVVENGITKKTTRSEFVDDRGNTRTKTETTWTDEEGRVIMRQVQSSSARSQQWQARFGGRDEGKKEDSGDDELSDSSKESKAQKKDGGWFWK